MNVSTAARERKPKWTNRDGTPLALALTFASPFIVIWNGAEVENYGDDQKTAMAHYDRLVAERNARAGRLPVLMGA